MNTLIALNIVGWLLAASLLIVFLGARRVNRDWKRLYEEKSAALDSLERKHLVVELQEASLDHYRNETTRLHSKLANICAQIRKMKGRGKSGVSPMHNF